MSAAALAGRQASRPFTNGRRIPSTADEDFAETLRPAAARDGERRKRFAFASFTPPL
jgi:hypothetical protein